MHLSRIVAKQAGSETVRLPEGTLPATTEASGQPLGATAATAARGACTACGSGAAMKRKLLITLILTAILLAASSVALRPSGGILAALVDGGQRGRCQ